jgi:Family of unknown function (DUF6263)
MRARTILLPLLLFLGACPDKKSSAPSSAPAQQAPSAHHDIPPLDDPGLGEDLPPDIAPREPPAPPKLTLVTPGAEPRKKLAYAFGGKTRTVDATLRRSLKEGTEPAEVVSFHYVFTATPEVQDGGADATIKLKVQKLDLTLPPDAPADAVQGAHALASGFQGAAAQVDVTAGGRIGDPQYATDAESDAVDMMTRVLEELVVPLPDEPVGIGAKWQEALTKHDAQGLDVNGTTTMTLVARDADTATIEVEASNTGKVALNVPGAPKGTQLERSVKSKSRTVIRLDGVAAKSDGTTKIAMTQKVPGEPDEAGVVEMALSSTSK